MAISTVNITNKQNAGEPATQGAFTIARTGDLTQPLTVKLNTISQFSLLDASSSSYATPGEDYQVLPTTVTFAAGQSSLDLPVIPIDDTIPESTQTVKVSIVADAAYTLGTSQTATVLITDNDLAATIPAGTLKTAAEAGYTIRKIGSDNISGLHLISGNIVVWQEGNGVTATLKLFDGKETKTLSTETSNYYKALNFSSLVASYAHVDSGKVIWGQYVDEPSAGGTPLPAYHTFLYDGTTTTDIGKTGGNAQIAGDRIAWAAADGIHVYRISDKSNTLLVPEAKNVDPVTLFIDGDKSIVWNENTRATSLSGVSAQTLRFYDGTKIVDLVTLPAGQDAYTQPAIIRAAVSGSKVVYVSKGDLYLYNNGQSTKIAESLSGSATAGIDFGISGDRVFYHVLEPYKGLSNERWYGISSGKIENPIENNLGSAGSISDLVTLNSTISIRNPITDGKNNAWIDPEYVLVTPANPVERDNLYIDDGTTRVKLATSDISLAPYGTFVPAAISGSSVVYDVLTKDAKTGSSTFDLYLASKASSPTPPVNNPPVNNPPVVANPIATQSIVLGTPLKFALAANTFTDPDAGDVLSYSAKLANGNNLPTWLTFDAVTRTFAGTPAAGDAGNLSISVTATDKAGLKVSSNFGLNVTAAVIPPVNNPTTTNFTSPTKFAVGIGPNSVTSGDFNGDGILDLVTANGSNTVSVLLGNGKGSFSTATNFAAGNAPNSITARDFNGDGILDLVTANLLSNNVSVLRGDGKGSFGTPTQFDVGYFPSFVTVGDFNGDRILDLVTSDPYNNNLSVLLGDGKGSFGTPAKFAVLNHPNSVLVSDFNGDGIADLATTNYVPGNSSVSVLLGNGKGGFGAPTSFAVGVHPDVDGNPILATVGDFNGDGISDLATANYGSIDVSVLLGNGKGSFATATNFAVGGSPTSVTVGDFNGDGLSDLATTNSAYSISVLLGNGKGSFATATNFQGYHTPTSATVGDFNGDGLSDLAIAESDGNDVSILLNQNVATSVNNAPVVANPIATQSIISGSPLKFSLTANTFTDPDTGDVLSYSAKLANGNNLPTWLTFDTVTRTFAGTPAAGDVGNFGIVVTATDKAGLTVTNSFGLNVTPSATSSDFNGDRKSDILWRNTDGSVATWLMNSSTATPISVGRLTSDWTIAGTGDFNSDGKADLLLSNPNGSVATWQMNGGAVTVSKNIGTATTGWTIAGTADFNSDGTTDLLWSNADGSVATWQINDGVVTAAKNIGIATTGWKIAGTADFNGDGKADILWRKTDGDVAIWQMDGSAVTKASLIATASTDWKIAGTADFNGDGKADILWRKTDGAVALWQMDGGTVTAAKTIGSATADWKIAATGDYNGDGNADILWRNDLGSVATWQMNGSNVLAAGSTSISSADPSWKIATSIL